MRPIFISFAFRYSICSKVFFRLSFTNKHCAVKPSQYQFKLIRKAGQEHLTQFVESDSQPSTNTRTSIVSNKIEDFRNYLRGNTPALSPVVTVNRILNNVHATQPKTVSNY